MSESNNLPQAISHKKLSYLMLKAQKDSLFSDELAEIESPEKREFEELINNWEDSTKKVVNELSKRKENLLKDKSPNSLINFLVEASQLNINSSNSLFSGLSISDNSSEK